MNIVDIISSPSGPVQAANLTVKMCHHEIVISDNSSLSFVPSVDDFEQAPTILGTSSLSYALINFE
jgi:hypothetical protein